MSKRLLFLFLIVFACTLNSFCQVKGVPIVKLFEKTYYKYEVKAKETVLFALQAIQCDRGRAVVYESPPS